MLKVIINGYNGTMGKVLSQCIKEDSDLELVCGVSRSAKDNDFDNDIKIYKSMADVDKSSDVIIDFSHHTNLDSVLKYALDTRTPIVLATTGYNEEDLKKIEDASKIIPILLSSNTSLGINLLIKLVKNAAKVLEGFDIEIIEKHHNRKVDAPSGTAITIADAIKEILPDSINTYGRYGRSTKRKPNEVGIHAIRGGTIVGEHDIIFAGDNEVLTITHNAQSRTILANGALTAAKYLTKQEPGFYNMNNMLD